MTIENADLREVCKRLDARTQQLCRAEFSEHNRAQDCSCVRCEEFREINWRELDNGG
jgi:hypothetical protein